MIPIKNNTLENGGFAVIKGSHKANFPIPYPKRSKEEASLLEYVDVKIGDALLFTEAMTHGSLENVQGLERQMVFYCYSLDYMPDWGTQGLKISSKFKESVPEQYKKYL